MDTQMAIEQLIKANIIDAMVIDSKKEVTGN